MMDSKDKSLLKVTGKRYSSVEELMKGEGVSSEVKKRVADNKKKSQISMRLTEMRLAAGLTQGQMAKRIGRSQSCISKWESESDDELTLKTIAEYCRVLDQKVGIVFGKQMGHVERVKMHALELRESLMALAQMAEGDEDIEKGIQAFFGEAFFNLLDIFSHCQNQLPNGGEFEIRMEIQEKHPSARSVSPSNESASNLVGSH